MGRMVGAGWIVAFGLALAACGVPQPEHDKVVAERDALQKELNLAKEKVAQLEKAGGARRLDRVPPSRTPPPAEKIDAWLAEAEITRGSKLKATIQTSMGDIPCTLFPDKSPLTVANFVALAEGKKEWNDPTAKAQTKKPLYDGTIFHRVIKGFMIQGGDPLGNGRGGPGYRFEDEVDNGLSFNEPGLLAMANSGPATNGSQFFITDSTPGHLTGKHTIFGKCELPNVQKIIATPTKPGDRPETDVVIQKIVIERS